MTNNVKVFLVLIVMLLPALYIGLGARPIYKIQEVRIAETSREMLVTNDWVVPRYNGELRLQKPPLPYWLTAASYKILGVSESATRIPSIIFSALTALLLFVWLSQTSKLSVTANTALILIASFIGLRYSRSGEADATLLFFIAAACYLGYQILQDRASRAQILLFYVALGLGFLTKGPAGVAIPLLTVFIAGLLLKRLSPIKKFWSFSGVLLFGVIAFGWYGWILWQMPDIAQHFFSRQADETFITGTHAKPAWWYVVHIFDFYLPWGLLILPAGIWLYKSRPLPELVRFALVWLAVVFVLLTFTVNKQMQYALLFAPPLAILLGHYLESAHGGFARCNRVLFYGFCLVAIGALGYFAYKKVAFDWQSLGLLGIVLVPFILKRTLGVSAPSAPILLVASLTSAFYIFGEVNLASDPEKTDAPLLMAQVKGLDNLYQAEPADGAISYYAERVIPPLKNEEIIKLLGRQPEVLLIAKEMPEIPGVTAQAQHSEGRLTLWNLKPQR